MNLFYITTAIELLTCTYLAHHIITWLKKDSLHDLVGYFFLYLTALTMSHTCNLYTIHYILWWGIPTVSVLFVLLHQEQLQKNFITIAHKKATTAPSCDIITALLQIGLHNSLHKKSSFFIVEGNQNLDSLLYTPLPLHITIQTELVNALCASNLYQEYAALWIHFDGTIKGINAYISHLYGHHKPHTAETQKETTTILSGKTDSFMLICTQDGQWTFIHDKTYYGQLTTTHIQQLVKKKNRPFKTRKELY